MYVGCLDKFSLACFEGCADLHEALQIHVEVLWQPSVTSETSSEVCKTSFGFLNVLFCETSTGLQNLLGDLQLPSLELLLESLQNILRDLLLPGL